MDGLLTPYATLDEVLRADPVRSLYKKMDEAEKAYHALHPDEAALEAKLLEAVHRDPEVTLQAHTLDLDNPIDLKTLSGLIGMPEVQINQVRAFMKEARKTGSSAIDDDALIEAWKVLKKRVGIKDVGERNFLPSLLTRPMLVLFSADWCPPCRIMRPTFAHLVSFFDKADVRYCHEDEWRRAQGVRFIPQFVAFFPNGAKVSSGVPITTQEIWDTMNKLVTLGQSFEGTGVLQCTDETCSIVAKEKE